jgi:hypothetical protein
MTQNNKPEWFEITDKDEKPEHRKASKSLSVSAVLVVALLLGAGAIFGQNQNETPASATNVSALQTPQATVQPTTAAAAAVVGAAKTSKLVNPSIAQLPTGGGDDENEDDHHGRGHDEGENNHEGDDD